MLQFNFITSKAKSLLTGGNSLSKVQDGVGGGPRGNVVTHGGHQGPVQLGGVEPGRQERHVVAHSRMTTLYFSKVFQNSFT